MNRALPFATVMSLEGTKPSEINQRERYISYGFTYILHGI